MKLKKHIQEQIIPIYKVQMYVNYKMYFQFNLQWKQNVHNIKLNDPTNN